MIIGICDDDRIWMKRAVRLLEGYIAKERQKAEQNAGDAQWEIHTFTNSEELFSYEGVPLDVLFLDIELKNENGIQIARQVNACWESCQIAYLTNHLQYAMDVYESAHMYYVLKEQFAERLPLIFEKIRQGEEQRSRKLLFFCIGGRVVQLSRKEILYFERHYRSTTIVTVWGKYEIHERIGEIEEKVQYPEFCRCHTSYLVNFEHVREKKKNGFCMENNEEITISRGYASKTKEAFARWLAQRI